MYKMEKVTNLKLFEPKITHISGCKLVYKYTIATITVHICTVTVACVFIILLISRSYLFCSLFSVHNKLSDFSSSHLLFPQMHTNTPAHKHTHTDKSTQRYINTSTHKQTHTDKPIKRQIGAWSERSVLDWNNQCLWVLFDRCLWVLLDRSSCVLLDQCLIEFD